jgi:hypothetical protein
MPSGQGVIELDFGGGNGSNEASVAVTGLSSILSTNAAEAFVMYEASTDYTADDQAYLSALIGLTCGVPTDGVGFTIYARSTEELTGKIKLRYVYA